MLVDDSLGLCDEGIVVLGSLHFWSWLCWSDMIGALCDEGIVVLGMLSCWSWLFWSGKSYRIVASICTCFESSARLKRWQFYARCAFNKFQVRTVNMVLGVCF
jgi:hypothetical protein